MVLFAAPVFITQATVPANWQSANKNLQARYDIRELQCRNEILKAKKAALQGEKDRTELTRVRADKTRECSALQDRVTAEKNTNSELQNNLKQIGASYMEIQKTLKLEVQQRVLLSGQITTAREKTNSLKSTIITLEDQVKAGRAEIERQGKVVVVLREQLADRDDRIAELENTGSVTSTKKTRTTPVTGDLPRIDGTVINVSNNLAGINIGSAKGIKRGMKLIIYRGTQFVAHLRVEEVQTDQAAGIIIDNRLTPISGDKVTTTLK